MLQTTRCPNGTEHRVSYSVERYVPSGGGGGCRAGQGMTRGFGAKKTWEPDKHACRMKNFIGLAIPSISILNLPKRSPSFCKNLRFTPLSSTLFHTHQPVKMPSIEHPTIKGKDRTLGAPTMVNGDLVTDTILTRY